MSDDPNVPPVEIPPNPPPPQEALDESGVPWKNRVAEWERKAKEQEALNEQYRIALGAQQPRQAPSAPVVLDDDELFNDQEYLAVEQGFTPDVQKLIRTGLKRIGGRIADRAAKRTGYEFVSQAGVQNEMQDSEVAQEARQQYAALANNPLWSQVPDVLKQEHAVAMAGKIVNARRVSKGQTTQTEEARVAAERALAGGASLPNSRGGAPPAQPKSREEYVKQFISDPQNIADFRTAYGRALDPNSEKGQKAFREAAEIAYDVGPKGMWGGKTAVATRILEEENRQ